MSKLRRGILQTACAFLVVFFSTDAVALNGKHVTLVNGKMLLSIIQNNAVTGSQTMGDDQIQAPQFSFDGTKIACWRNNGGKWYLSVMNVANNTFTNLMDISQWTSAAPKVAMGSIRWPAGDWIYFVRPDTAGLRCGEVWRVNSADPSKKELLVDYVKPTGSVPRAMYNFALTPDVRLAMAGLGTTSGMWMSWQPVHRFPPTGDDPLGQDNFLLELPNCNPCLAPTGAYAGRFLNGNHQSMYLYQWNNSNQTYVDATGFRSANGCDGHCISNVDIEGWSGQADWANTFEGPDWSVNSDRWLTMGISTPNNETIWTSVVFSWADRKAIRMTSSTTTSSPGGCLYVEGAANNVQRIDGTWSAIAPVTVIPRIDVAGSHSPYHITLSSSPAGAEIYYTTDGADPTQSSTHYTGPFSLSVPATSQTILKARAYLSGQGSSNVMRRFIYFDMTKSFALTCELWTGIPGKSITDLTSHPGYPGTPDRTWLAYDMTNQYGSPWTQVPDGSQFGYRVRGYLIPKVTGPYVLNYSDAFAAMIVRIGTSSDPASTVEYLNLPWQTGTPWTRSNPITLQAGVWHYLEVLVKGDDRWCELYTNWTSPYNANPAIMPMDSTPPIQSAAIDTRGGGATVVGGTSITVSGRDLRLAVRKDAPHDIRIVDSRGRTMFAIHGTGMKEYRVDLNGIAGVLFASIRCGNDVAVTRAVRR